MPRRYPVGAELVSADEISLRVWSPGRDDVRAIVDGTTTHLAAERNGYLSAVVPGHAGSRYGFLLGGDDRVYPDPVSRWLPDGPEGLSAVPDLGSFTWRDNSWPGVALKGQVLYELHVGTCTRLGTWRAAEALLPRLAQVGVTVIQMMPVAESAGEFGWGYDGVQWFAPWHTYGDPADLQRFVDVAHANGLGVILDVVYNHLGPSGNFLGQFDPRWKSTRHESEWGETPNFDDAGSEGIRSIVTSNVAYWVREFHVDGFRLDAAQQIFDDSSDHILAAIVRTARSTAEPRRLIVIAEHEGQDARLVREPAQGGYGLDGIFNEDFHHSCRVALTGIREAYFSDYRGTTREWLALATRGFLFQGQYYPWQSNPRGVPALDRPPEQFVCFLENHDQGANSAEGRRLIELTSEAWWRAMSTLLLLGPWTPLLFQGQESGASTPFRYVADHAPELQEAVARGRRQFLAQFPRSSSQPLSEPGSASIGREVFEACRMPDGHPRQEHCRRLYSDLLTLRRSDPSLGQHATRLDGATAGDRVLILRFFGTAPHLDRLLVLNLDADVDLAALPEPLVAPPHGEQWHATFCSQDRQYGGTGRALVDSPERLMATGHAATVFSA
jgi:maltooligosyltrehalose trehalohydrolase